MKATTHLLVIITLCVPFMVFGQQKTAAPSPMLRTVVIDAGHGGKDPGCKWGDICEKDLNLKVALIFGGLISANYPDVNVIYTRSDDTFIELYERGDIANRANADLFISVHTDSVGNQQANGSSTYVMGNDKAAKNLEVAKRENSVIVLENDYQTKYEGYDPSSAESFIIFSLMQYAYSEQSMVLAEMVQKHYTKASPIVDRGARQAPYLVLWRTAMPSILTEMGFLSNASDRAIITSDEGQHKIASALFDSFKEYKTKCENKASEALSHQTATPRQAAGETKTQSAAPQTPKPDTATVPAASKTADTATVVSPTAASVATIAEPAPQKSSAGADTTATATAVKESRPKVEFYVQLCTLSAYSNPNDAKFRRYRGRIVQKKTQSGKYRCLVAADSYEAAVVLAKEAGKEFKGAFVAAFVDDEYTAVDKALRMAGR